MDANILFSADNIGKKFPGTTALANIAFGVKAGSIVGLIGENGAGKSTLLKIIMGVQPQSSGEMFMNGQPYAPHSPKNANAHGVGMVFQEQSLYTNLTVAQNIFFGEENRFRGLKGHGFINWKAMNEAAARALRNIGVDNISPEKRVEDYNFAHRQMIEFAKVFHNVGSGTEKKSLILLDEPTSILNDEEIRKLFGNVRKLRENGHGVVFVSHRLDEVLELCDHIYVLKDGKDAGNLPVEDADMGLLYEMMVGKTTSGEYYKVDRQTAPKEEVVMDARGLSLKGVFKNVTFRLHRSEILGLCGVEGSGTEELCNVLCGYEKPTGGVFFVKGRKARFGKPWQALKNGITTVPKERREEGIIGMLDIKSNIVISNLDGIKDGPFLSDKKQEGAAEELIRRLRIRCNGPDDTTGSLSGGNAQKVVFARVMFSGCDILILNHPTRGVDIGAKEEIYTLIRGATEEGASVLLLGDTLEEYIGLSSRIITMKDGLITGEFASPPDEKPEQLDIVKYMM